MAKTLWVSPDNGKWKVHFENEATLKTFEHKYDAIKYAKNIVASQPAGQVTSIRIQDAHGIVQAEWTYGKDPFPPRG